MEAFACETKNNPETKYFDIVVCGASLGGTIAAYAAAKQGKKVVLLEESDRVGGQLTSQAVPPDEHKWIETQGCTASYRAYRNAVRDSYRADPSYSDDVKRLDAFCPADSEVSYVSHPPRLARKILEQMLAPYLESGLLTVYTGAKFVGCQTGDKVHSVTYIVDGNKITFIGKYFLDGTDTGELVAASGVEYVTGAESKAVTGETHAPDIANPQDMQPATITAELQNRKCGDFVIDKPYMYDEFRKLVMPYDKYNVYSMYGPDSSTGKAKRFGMFPGERDERGEELFPLFKYRRIVCADYYKDGTHPYDVSLINWPQNDYFLGNLYETADAVQNQKLARLFTLGFVYWLQTEAPRADGGKGYRYLKLDGTESETPDGLSAMPYIRESRRIKAQFTVTENMIAKGTKPVFADSVGVGSYPIDLHITTQTHTFFYAPSERFTIPLGAFLPVRITNLLPACKNIGTTHLTNGCYRLHPVEWNVGEVAGLLASFAVDERVSPSEVRNNGSLFAKFVDLLEQNGIQRYWRD